MSDRLLELLRTRSCRQGRFTLASGRESDFFIDCKPVVLSAEGHALVGPRLLHAIGVVRGRARGRGLWCGPRRLPARVVGRSRVVRTRSRGALDAVYVRKVKDHGSKKRLEGRPPRRRRASPS
ncbi:MAG: hypothetical protein R3B99_19770 [Polyangiales bacterium]